MDWNFKEFKGILRDPSSLTYVEFRRRLMPATTMCVSAVPQPARTHHRNGRGSIAYGAYTTKRMYHMSRCCVVKFRPAPMKPVREKKKKKEERDQDVSLNLVSFQKNSLIFQKFLFKIPGKKKLQFQNFFINQLIVRKLII